MSAPPPTNLSRRSPRRRWGSAALLLALGWLVACARTPELPVLSTLPDVTLTERSGEPVSIQDLRGEVWVAHFMFTRCEGPCPRMVAEMKALKAEVGDHPDLRWVSISADPTYDSPEVLGAYAERFTEDAKGWLFLTGAPKDVYHLAEAGFLLPVTPGSAEAGTLITHSLRMAVVDREGRVRAYLSHFEGDNPERLKATLKALL